MIKAEKAYGCPQTGSNEGEPVAAQAVGMHYSVTLLPDPSCWAAQSAFFTIDLQWAFHWLLGALSQ